MADVVDDHGLLQGGDATGEPAPDRDAHAGLDLLLDPDGRGRDELVRVLVEQQHRAGVDLEQLAGPQEERVEEIVETQVRERGVGQRLESLQPPVGREGPVLHRNIVTNRAALQPGRGRSLA